MGLDVAAVQAALRADALDGWLLYDFHGSNPIAAGMTGAGRRGHMTTRRWYYLIPAQGQPTAIVHAIERHNLDHLPGETIVYAGRQQLDDAVKGMLKGLGRVAMEYSPLGAIPYLSRLDAGTAEMIRRHGIDIVSSGDLVQRFAATWTAEQLATHRSASDALYRIKDRAFEAASSALAAGRPLSEYELQQQMTAWFREERLVSDSPPVVAVGPNAGNPHYLPTADHFRAIGPDEVLLLDLWGKHDDEGAVFADITWVGFTAARVPEEPARAFQAIVEARDAAVALVQTAAQEGRDLRGWEVDRAARTVLDTAGYGRHILHRTGHSLGETVHGNGVHMDDYETHDDRRLLPGTGFTVEPGLYFESFGVRTEINVFRGERGADVTGVRQTGIVTLR